jgi:hypothetical protein
MSQFDPKSAGDAFDTEMREVIRTDETLLMNAHSIHNRNHGLDISSFFADFAFEREQDKLDRMRWTTPADKSPPSSTLMDLVFDPYFPKHVYIHPDAIKDINIKVVPSKSALDTLCEEIFDAVAARLPRRLNAYFLNQEKAEDTLYVPGIGELTVKISSNANTFISIREIRSDSFCLHNGRCSGRQYLGNYNDVSRIGSIEIHPLRLEVTFYDDHSPRVARYKGITYQGHGDDLSFSQDDLNLSSDPEVMAAIAGKDTWDLRFGEFGRTIPETLNRPSSIKWGHSLGEITEWLEKNVKMQLLALPECASQATTLEKKPYLDQYPSLYTWVLSSDLTAMVLSNYDASRLRPHERLIIKPKYRFLPYGEGENIPKLAHNSFIWCGIGEPIPHSDPTSYNIRGQRLDSSHGDYRNQLVRIRPNSADGIYIVDYGPYETMRASLFQHTDRLSTAQYHQTLTALVDTLVPIHQYQGGYQMPVVLSNRGFEMSEILIVEGVKYDPRVD